MTTQTSSITGWRRAATAAVASAALAAGLLAGASSALADPADPVDPSDPTAEAEAAPQMTADQALGVIAQLYDTGAGGGKISTLIHKVMKLRQAGYRPSTSNGEALVAALDKRPNQAPLVEALEKTLAFQTKQMARGQAQAQQPTSIGINQLPPGNGGTLGAPQTVSNLPIG